MQTFFLEDIVQTLDYVPSDASRKRKSKGGNNDDDDDDIGIDMSDDDFSQNLNKKARRVPAIETHLSS